MSGPISAATSFSGDDTTASKRRRLNESQGQGPSLEPALRLAPVLVPNLFAEFSALAAKHGSANLGQGFPSFGAPAVLQEKAAQALEGDAFTETGRPAGLGSQYTRPGGEPALVAAIAKEYSAAFAKATPGGTVLDGLTQVVTTVGAQEGIFQCLFAFTEPGDEIVVLEPCFDALVKSANVLGLKVRGVPIRCPPPKERTTAAVDAPGRGPSPSPVSADELFVDLAELERAFSPRTRFFVINTPSSPFGKVFTPKEMDAIAGVVERVGTNCLVMSDEVYEKVVFDARKHEHFAMALGGRMFARTMTLFSAGKTFSCTGWRVGYIIAPAPICKALLSSHCCVNFSAATPLQKALVDVFAEAGTRPVGRDGRPCCTPGSAPEFESYYDWLSHVMQRKRDALVAALSELGLDPIVPAGGYFLVCRDMSRMLAAAGIDDPDCDAATGEPLTAETPLGARPDVRLCRWMTEHVGVTAIPCSPFYLPEERHLANRMVRFAFCKDEATLTLACQRLRKWAADLRSRVTVN